MSNLRIEKIEQLTQEELKVVGEKAKNLSKLRKKGFLVPDAFIVFGNIKNINFNDEELKRIFTLCDEIKTQNFAVRSSSQLEDTIVKSNAGVYDSCLNVSLDVLIDKIKFVSQSMNEDSGSIIVMSMLKSKYYGVAFSINPINSKNEVIIEIGNSADKITSGGEVLSRYIINKHDFSYTKYGASISWDESEMIKIFSENIIALEGFMSAPVDIEWGWKNSQLYLLQCRVITAINTPVASANLYNYMWSTQEPYWTMELGFFINSGMIYNIDYINLKNEYPLSYKIKEHIYIKNNYLYEYYINNIDYDNFNVNKNYITKMLSNILNIFENVRYTFNHISKDLNKISIMSKSSILNVFIDLATLYCDCIMHYDNISGPLSTKWIEEKIRNKVDPKDFLSIIQCPILDLIEQEYFECNEMINTKPENKEIIKHIYKYPFIGLPYNSVSEIIKDIKNRTKTHSLNRLNVIKKRRLNRQTLMKKYGDEVNQLLSILDQISLSRAQMKYGWAGVHLISYPIFDWLAEKHAIKKHLLVNYYGFNDLINLILHNQKVDEKEIKNRSNCIWHMDNGVYKYLNGNKAIKYINSLQLWTIKNKSTIVGVVASFNTEVVGEVLIVDCNSPYKTNIRPGCIIVTEMVQPNMIDLIYHSNGVVTNEGGLLSHAAILCRELKKTCIVETKNATKQLSTGDLVMLKQTGEIIKGNIV